jgi:hypothetical protein
MKKHLQIKGAITMKRLGLTLIALSIFLFMSTGIVWATVGLPTANIAGNTQTTATSFQLVGASISKVNYLDGTSATTNGVDESIIGMSVVISGATRTGDFTFQDATITVSDGTFNYLSATLSDVVFVTDGVNWFMNPGLDVNDPSTMNLSNIVLNTDIAHPSKYIDELAQVKGSGDQLGMQIEIFIFSGTIQGDSQGNIFSALIDGSPAGGGPTEPPSGVRTIGYWKNHDFERGAFVGGAVALSTVFSTADDLNLALAKKGKKTMEEKAKQQLAALLLNISAGFDTATLLASGELDILNLFGTGTTVGEALSAIELVITTSDNANMENAKDLADEINNRDHNNL